MSRLQTLYRDKIAKDLQARFGYQSAMQVPRITKICLNQGLGIAITDRKHIEGGILSLIHI